MKARRLIAPALLLIAALACTDRSPTSVAPVAPPQADLIGSLLAPTGLLKCSDLPYASSKATIGPDGGSISAGPHTLMIPAGALSAPTTITMTAPTGRGVNVVEFAPAGLQFARSASLTMSYSNCSLLGTLLPKRIAYTSSSLDVLYYILSLDNIFSKRVTGQVNHFSNYAIAW
ncbi:MAG TPA: hypothetical protein VNJ06_04915 [Gemmatimonadales bacterium]|nr:hypothetical protein [Gemmatimonadales bacterium]